MITWKGFALIVLTSYVTASTADVQPTSNRRILAMLIGLYGLILPLCLFIFMDMGLLELML